MVVKEPGHIYELYNIDDNERPPSHQILTFVNREPGDEHSGTQTQEVLRALIDRTMHCDNCLPWAGDSDIVYHLRMALVLHEARALVRKVEKHLLEPENVATSPVDGHFALGLLSATKDSDQWVGRTRKHTAFPQTMAQCNFGKKNK
jgi:hypothetical protein